MKKFAIDIITIGDWIIGCINHDQVNNLENLYRQIVSKQYYPEVDELSLSESLDHLSKMVLIQNIKISSNK